MNLKTSYLGLSLKNPLVVGASPFCDNLTACRELEAAGASAIVMHSFFEEQIDAHVRTVEVAKVADQPSWYPRYEDYRLDPEQYLRQLTRLRKLVGIPVIASLNGSHVGNWIGLVQRMEDAGAAAIEVNLYQVPTDPAVAGDEIEADMLQLVRSIAAAVKIPVAVKLSAAHTALAHFAHLLGENGAAGLVLFNRFYQPDFDLDQLKIIPRLRLSDSGDLVQRLRWLSILSPRFPGALACSGGVHTTEDLIKALLAGADAVQVVSALLKHGPRHLETLLAGLQHWMQENGFASVDDLRGRMNLRRCPNPTAFERAHYLKVLQSWQV